MHRRIAVGDIMTRELVSVKSNASLHDCAKELVKQRVNTILVSENKKLLGIVTARDILWAITKKPNLNLKEIKIIDIAKRKVAVIKPSADIKKAFLKMKRYGFRRLPVLSKGNLIGILTIKDILRIDPSIYASTSDLFDMREETQKLKKVKTAEKESPDIEGFCEECNEFAPLRKESGKMLCPYC